MMNSWFRLVLMGWLALAGQAMAADAGPREAEALLPPSLERRSAEPSARLDDDRGPSLGTYLDASGRLELPKGFNSSLDPAGFTLVSKPSEPPRFAPKNVIDDAARWDPQFGQAIGCDGTINAMASFADGRILLGGSFTYCGNVRVNRVAIWNPATGTFASLGTGAANGLNGVNDVVFAVAVAGTNAYLGGRFMQAGGAPANNVARFNTSTQTWASLGAGAANGVNNQVRALGTDGSDVYVGGGFTQAGGATANSVARFSATTQMWLSLGVGAANGVTGSVLTLAIAGSDVYAGGGFTQAGGATANGVARFNTTTQAWSSLGVGAANGVAGSVLALAIAGGDVYVGGEFTAAGGAPANNVARFNTGAQAWSPLRAGPGNGVSGGARQRALALGIAGSDVYVGGEFTDAGGAPANHVARFSTSTQAWSTLGTGATNGVAGGSRPQAYAVAIAGNDVYVGGAFTEAGGAMAYRAARFNTVTRVWSTLGAGVSNGVGGNVYAVAIAGSDLYVGGNFNQAGGATANRVARFSTATQTWSPLGNGTANGVDGNIVYAVAIAGSDIYVGGDFGQAGGAAANGVARFNTITQTWSSLGTGAANGVNGAVFAIAIAGSDVYLGGSFSQAGDAPANNVARFNAGAQAWAALGTGAANGTGSAVYAIAVAGGDVYVGGNFTQAGGAPANYIARFNTNTQAWSPLGAGAANGVGGCVVLPCVNAVAVVGGDVFAGGTFTQAGGATANFVARFDTGTQAWSSLGSGAANGVDDEVRALAIAGSDVYVGGSFTQAAGVTTNRLARFNAATQAWPSLGAGLANGANDRINALAIAGGDVYMGGFFTEAGPNASLRVARYDARRETTASVSASDGPAVTANSAITFTGSVATTGFAPQPGAVEFLDNGAVIPPCANVAVVGGLDTRTATCTVSNLRAGAHNIVARYKGDSLNSLGTSDPVAIEVVPPSFAYSPATLPGATFNIPGYSSGTILVSTATGTGVIAPVSFQIVDPAELPPGLNSAPLANGILITGTPTQAGTFNFTVRATDSSTTSAVGGAFSSDRQYTIVVAKAAQTINPITRVDAVPLDNGVASADGDFAVQSTASSGLPVAIDSTTPTVCQVGPPGATVRPLQLGTCTLRARQPGNSNYEAAPEVLRTFQLKATPDVIIDSAPNPSLLTVAASAPDTVVLTATVASPAGGAPTGTVRFLRAGNTIAGCAAQPVAGSGGVSTATCSTSSLVRGSNTITAQYSGDALNIAATSNVHTHQLNVVTAVGIATITPSPCVVGEGCTVAVAVAASPAASGTSPGSVQVGSSTGGSCTVTLASGGGSCALTATAAGTGTVTATYLGSPPWLASPATTQLHPFVATVDELFGNGFEPPVGTLLLQ